MVGARTRLHRTAAGRTALGVVLLLLLTSAAVEPPPSGATSDGPQARAGLAGPLPFDHLIQPRLRTRSAAAVAASHLAIDPAAVRGLPTEGAAWEAVRSTADGTFPPVDLADQDSLNPGRTLAAALVYVRTGERAYRDRAVQQLRAVPTSDLRSARVLSVARQVAGYAIAADLIGYRDAAFFQFVQRIRTLPIGNHGRFVSLSQTSENTASNWGAWALASRIAASRYVGDMADVAAAAEVFRGFLGDRSAHEFQPTSEFDVSFVCGDPDGWVPINPPGCRVLDGALVEEMSRSALPWPDVDDTARAYAWEALGGAVLSAQLLHRAGYDDVHDWGDRALLRAAQFLQRTGGYPPIYSTNQYIPWAINDAYGTDLGPLNPAGAGRQFGFTDWLAGG